MYGLTRATITLLGVAVAGLLIWTSTQVGRTTSGFYSNGAYWEIMGLIAAAGLVMALSQLLGGWTKWGWPRLAPSVFLFAFIPVLIVVAWITIYDQPSGNWLRSHIQSWTGDIHVRGLVHDLSQFLPVLAFGAGLVFGYSFDTTGPAEPIWRRRKVAGAGAVGATTTARDEQRVESREGGETPAPPPEPAPRPGEPPPS